MHDLKRWHGINGTRDCVAAIKILVLCPDVDGRLKNPHAIKVVADLDHFRIPTRGMPIRYVAIV